MLSQSGLRRRARLQSVLCLSALADSPDREGLLQNRSVTAGCPGLQPGSVGDRLKERKAQVSLQVPYSWSPCLLLCSKGKRGRAKGGSGCGHWASELLQATVHLSLALFPCPGPALGAELL